MAQVSGKIIQELLLILTPFMRDKQQRQAYLELALGTDSPVLNLLVWDTSADVFITQMVNKLVAFGEIPPGKPALCALLEVVRENVGLDKQLEIDNLLQRIRQELKKQQPPSGIWRCLHTLNEHSGSVESVAISPDGRILASGSSDKTINLWELNTGRLLYTMKGHSTIVRSVAFSPDGKTLASSSNIDTTDSNIKLWDVYTGKLRQTLGGGLSTFRVNSLAFNPEGNIIATGQVNIIKLWDLETGKELETLWGHAIDVNSLAFTPDGQFLVAGCSQGEIKIWDWQNRSPLRTINPAGNLLGSIVSLFNPNGMLWSVAISPDAQMIASGGSNRAIALWNFHTGEVIRTLTQHLSDVHCVAFSPNGQILASGSQDKTIRIWNIHTGDLLYTFEHLGEVNCVAFSPDGKTLVSADNARIIKVWGVSN